MPGALAVAVVGSVMAVGTVHVLTLLWVAPVVLLAGVWAIRAGNARLPAPALVLLGLSLVCALQAVPLPIGLLAKLNPAGLAVWQTAAALVGKSLSFAPVSLDPGASLVEALKWLSYSAAFIAAARTARARDGRWLLALVFGSALLTAFVTLAHRLMGAETLFGVYRPVFTQARFATSPLLNPNNLAGYLNLGAFAGIALLVVRKLPVPRWAVGMGLAVLVGLSAVSGSRAGLASLLGGAVLALLLLLRPQRDGRRVRRSVVLGLGAALAGGFGLFALAADREVWRDLFEEGGQKLSLIGWTGQLVRTHFWTGVGRGAFETAFPAYRADDGHHVYQFAENFVMQWCCEWGVPLSIAALAALFWLLRPSRLGVWQSPSAAVGLAGVLTLLAQNLLDLGLEIPAVSLAMFTLLGGLWGAARRDEPTLPAHPEAWRGFAAFATALWVTVAFWGRPNAVSDRATLAQVVKTLPSAPERSDPDLDRSVRSAVWRHPADPFLPLAGAIVARAHGGNALPWIGRAIERDPMAGRPYLLLAQELAQRGARTQALNAVSRAAEREYAILGNVASFVSSLRPSWADVLQAVPDGAKGANLLTALAVRRELVDLRAQALDEAIFRDPRFLQAPVLRAQDLALALEQTEPPCSGNEASCVARIVELSRAIERIQPDGDEAIVLRARVSMVTGHASEALQSLASRCATLRHSERCFHWQVQLAARAHDPAALSQAAESYIAAACSESPSCAPAAAWLGWVFEQARDDARALRYYERAARELDTSAAWKSVAMVAKRMGLENEARAAERRGARPGARSH